MANVVVRSSNADDADDADSTNHCAIDLPGALGTQKLQLSCSTQAQHVWFVVRCLLYMLPTHLGAAAQ
jgi:hypothetical protein